MNFKFFNSMVISDFLLLNTSIKNKKLLELKKNIKILNIFLLNRSMRQFIKCLVYARNQKMDLTIRTKNEFLKYLIYKVLKKNNFKIKVNFKKLTNFIGKNKKNEIVIIAENLISLNSTFLKLFKNSVFLISKITMNKNFENNSIYKIFNNLVSFKKIIFFSLILKKILLFKNDKI